MKLSRVDWCRYSVAVLAAGLSAGLSVGCAPEPVAPEGSQPGGAAVDPIARRFSFDTLDGEVVSSSSLRGRMTVIVALTTYDDASQAQARFLKNVTHTHEPRINALALALERKENLPLVKIFADSFDLPFPLAMAGEDILAGSGALPGLSRVPSTVLLDREGREVWRHIGLVEAAALSEVIAEYDDRAR